MTGPVVQVEAAAATDPGRVRPINEDAYLIAPPFFLVADGLGGHADGEVASRTVVEVFDSLAGGAWATSDDLLEGVARATAEVTALSETGRAPGSTLSGVALSDQGGTPCWLVFNIGDSRTYLVQDGRLHQLTLDHSALTGAGGAAGRNVVTRAIGGGLDRVPATDQWLIPIETGDRVLICSDGLTNEVTDPLIQACLMSEREPRATADALVAAAREAGGRDNITVVVVDAVSVVPMSYRDELSGDTLPDNTLPDHTQPIARVEAPILTVGAASDDERAR